MRTLLVWIVLLGGMLAAVSWLRDGEPELPPLSQQDFAAAVEAEQVIDVQIAPEALHVMLHDGRQYRVPGFLAPELAARLAQQEIGVWAAPPESSAVSGLLPWLGGLVALVALFVFFLRRMGAGGANLMAL